MPSVVDSDTNAGTPGRTEITEDQYVRLGQVLDFTRAHAPPRTRVAHDAEPLTNDHCLIIPQADIQQFHLAGGLKWASYEAVTAAFAQARAAGTRSHNAPYAKVRVFAAVKVIVAERPNPIRALLAWEPVYPWRGILGTLMPDQRLWFAYAAVGLLNSPLGQALYDRELRAMGLVSRPDGLDKDALGRVPVALATYEEAALNQVARLTSQIAALYEAERECVAQFTKQIDQARERLNQALPRLLGMPERETHALLRSENGRSESSSLELPFLASDLLPPLPDLPPVRLLSNEQLARLAELDHRQNLVEAESLERDQLRRIRYWQEVVSDSLPDALGVELLGDSG